jgi:hypothetical protein
MLIKLITLKVKVEKGRNEYCFSVRTFGTKTSLVVSWLEFLTTDHEVPGSIPGSTMGIFPFRGRYP